tara:strand:+ start:1598 stop:2083 length:486 start_codon:yes stop_codon:yes gene_type:complete
MSQTDEAQPRQIAIFDTSLRDGEQAPGFSMNTAQKLKLAHALRKLKVDVMEVGFAAASPGDAEAIHAIASEIGYLPDAPMLCSLSRAMEGDIIAAERALGPAKRSRLHLFFGTSDLHLAANTGWKSPKRSPRSSARSRWPRAASPRSSSPPRTRCEPIPRS